MVVVPYIIRLLIVEVTTAREPLLYYSTLSVVRWCGQKSPSPIHLKLLSAGVNNVPGANEELFEEECEMEIKRGGRG